ncbi:MAG TPA: DUF4286 family protein, partial [Phycisphaerae bacterium]|nr:DUF4286 family protein [Phycisphaerae bacterium]
LNRLASFFYEVLATARDESSGRAWAEWLLSKHLADVIAAGAMSARLVKLDEPARTYAAQYEFESREAFDRYVRDHAPRLRAEGIELFGDRLMYTRRTGEIL